MVISKRRGKRNGSVVSLSDLSGPHDGFLGSPIKVVRENHRRVVFRLGRFLGVKGPGLVIRIPVVDTIQDFNLT